MTIKLFNATYAKSGEHLMLESLIPYRMWVGCHPHPEADPFSGA